jgi:hypothetical protein
MNRKTETLLLEEVAPRLRAAIPKTIPMVGSDDPEELLQDGLAIAIQIHRGAKRARKKVNAGNIAHYTILALRSGRRSTGIRKNDVLAPACQLNGHARVRSMDEPLRNDEDGDEPLTLHDCLAANVDDPATAAGRRLDWASVFDSLDRTAKAILVALVEGRELTLLVHLTAAIFQGQQSLSNFLARNPQLCNGLRTIWGLLFVLWLKIVGQRGQTHGGIGGGVEPAPRIISGCSIVASRTQCDVSVYRICTLIALSTSANEKLIL